MRKPESIFTFNIMTQFWYIAGIKKMIVFEYNNKHKLPFTQMSSLYCNNKALNMHIHNIISKNENNKAKWHELFQSKSFSHNSKHRKETRNFQTYQNNFVFRRVLDKNKLLFHINYHLTKAPLYNNYPL